MNSHLEIIGRQSSHFTRMVRMFALEVGVDYGFTPVYELMSRDPDAFAGNPALKLPILRVGGETVFGSLNICRVLAGAAQSPARVFWPGDSGTPLLMNAHELLFHAMSAEVDVVIHEAVEKRPPDNASRKRRDGLVNCLVWLDGDLENILDAMPAHDVSIFELGLYCLLSHLPFRNPLDVSGLRALVAFEHRFRQRESARATPYRFDAPPA